MCAPGVWTLRSSLLSCLKWVEMDISLCDSQRSSCHTSPLTPLVHHSVTEGSGKESIEGEEDDGGDGRMGNWEAESGLASVKDSLFT